MSNSSTALPPMQDTSVLSNYLKDSFNVKVFPAVHDATVKVISHDSLKNLLYNVLVVKYPDLNVKFESKLEFAKETGPNPGDGHFVYSFTIWDIRGRKVTEIGETVPSTLEGDIAKSIPAMTAFHRAMDRAVISYIDFEGKAFSTEEGVAYKKETYAPAPQKVDSPSPKAAERPAPVGKQPQGTSATEKTSSRSSVSEQTRNKSASSSAKSASAKTAAPEKYVGENIKINFPTSKHKGKTVDATWHDDSGYIDWLAGDSFKPTNETANKLKNAALACIAFYRNGGSK